MKLFLSSAASYLPDSVQRPPVRVSVNMHPSPFQLVSGGFLSLRDNAIQALQDANIEPVLLDIARWSDRFSGRVALFFFRMPDGTLSHRREGTVLKPEMLGMYLSGYHRNRITVNGITMSLSNVGPFSDAKILASLVRSTWNFVGMPTSITTSPVSS